MRATECFCEEHTVECLYNSTKDVRSHFELILWMVGENLWNLVKDISKRYVIHQPTHNSSFQLIESWWKMLENCHVRILTMAIHFEWKYFHVTCLLVTEWRAINVMLYKWKQIDFRSMKYLNVMMVYFYSFWVGDGIMYSEIDINWMRRNPNCTHL